MDEDLITLTKERKNVIDGINEMKKKKLILNEQINKKRNHKVGRPKESNVNQLIRVSKRLDKKIEQINNKREENGFDRLSKPKITELIVRHKNWGFIEREIIRFNIKLDDPDLNNPGINGGMYA